MKVTATKRASTLFLKAVIILIGVTVLALSVLSFFPVWLGGARELPEFTHVLYPGLIGLYATTIPFLFALYQAFKLLHSIDKNNAFSELSVKALKNIKYCAIAMSVLYATAMPLVFVMSDLDDAPGGVVIGLAFVVAPLIVATFAAVLQKLVRNAIDMKLENDLTV